MTVFRPSFPPVNCTTTRMVSLAPALSAGFAARAVRPRNAGTPSPQAMRLVDFRKSRRFVMSVSPLRIPVAERPAYFSTQLKFRQRQHQVRQRTGRPAATLVGAHISRQRLFAGLANVLYQLFPRLNRDIALDEQVQKETYHRLGADDA